MAPDLNNHYALVIKEQRTNARALPYSNALISQAVDDADIFPAIDLVAFLSVVKPFTYRIALRGIAEPTC
jgi:hypothetical protein